MSGVDDDQEQPGVPDVSEADLATIEAELIAAAGHETKTGKIKQVNQGKFGFIEQDEGGDEMFVIPGSCTSFGNAIPPVGTEVEYEVVVDQKTGRPRAENVRPPEGAEPAQGAPGHEVLRPRPPAGLAGSAGGAGTFISDQGKFGFIEQDSGGDNMFVMPKSFEGGVFPPIDTRVNYDVVLDSKTGRPRAEGVVPEQQSPWDPHQTYTGTVLERKSTDNFGFIEQDSGGDNMFVLPKSCAAFGDLIPPAGTRVAYKVVQDSKTGRPRAEDVEPESGEGILAEAAAPAGGETGLPRGWDAGTITDVTNADKFGFIAPDAGGNNMFVMPRSCTGFDGAIPPVGTRVIYRVVVDTKTGRPRAEDLQPEGADVQPVAPEPCKGGKGGKGGKGKGLPGSGPFGHPASGPPALMAGLSWAGCGGYGPAGGPSGGKGKKGRAHPYW